MSRYESSRLCLAALAAFREAREAAARGPQPNTPEWEHWQQLLDEAMAANQAYINSINVHSPARPTVRPLT
jgi:hypothetical protein